MRMLTILTALALASPAAACRLTPRECRVVEDRLSDMERFRPLAEQAFLARGERAFEAGADAIRASYARLARMSARDSRRIQRETERVSACRAALSNGKIDPECDDAY